MLFSGNNYFDVFKIIQAICYIFVLQISKYTLDPAESVLDLFQLTG